MRNRIGPRIIIGSFLIIIAILGYLTPENRLPDLISTQTLSVDFADHQAGSYTTIVDSQGRVISKTSRQVFPGDEIITARGEQYRVARVDDDIAQAELLGLDQELLAWSDYYKRYGDELTLPAVRVRETDVAIYHSHTDESYAPTSGKAFEEFGDINDVGRTLGLELRKNGLNIFHDTTSHNPHDAQAYERSRRTVARLLKLNPSILIDVHRDGVPDPDFFRREINGEEVTSMRLVVGRQNPNQEANTDFAKRLMARTNERDPGLIKEIFKGRGNYNQDLNPQAILIEAGTFTNSLDEAQRGVELLAGDIAAVMGGGPGPGPAPDQDARDQTGGLTGFRVALLIALVTLVALGAYLVVSAGGVPQAREKLNEFFRREFNEFNIGRLSVRLNEKRDNQNRDDQNNPGK